MVFFGGFTGFGLSIHSRKLASSTAQPAVVYPEDAQHVRTEAIISPHPFAACSLGRRTFSRGRGGRRMAVFAVEAPLGGIVYLVFLGVSRRSGRLW